MNIISGSRKFFWVMAVVCLVFSLPALSASPIANVTVVSTPSLCNSVDFHQVPGTSNIFIGRRLINTSSDGCSGTNWTLAQFQMDWLANSMNYVKDIINFPAALPSQSGTVTSGYDPTVAMYNGELWVAFECAGTGSQFTGPSSSCIAPLSSASYQLDISRMTQVVAGMPQSTNTDGYSASVPKLFVYQGIPYLYWTVIHLVNGVDGSIIPDITTRGAQIAQEAAGLKRLWVSGYTGLAVGASDSHSSYEVFGLDSTDPLSNGVADSFDVKIMGSQIILTTGTGGEGCTSPNSLMYACYRMQIRQSSTALGTHIFNNNVLNTPSLPFNPQEYSNIITDPSGANLVIGHYLDPTTNGSPVPVNTIMSGVVKYPIDLGSLVFGATDGTPPPQPATGAELLKTTTDVLQQFDPACNMANPLPNSGNASCFSSVDQYCHSQGYGAGGLLEEYGSGFEDVACVTAAHAGALHANISALSTIDSFCTMSNLVSDVCASAISAYCQANGYVSGGFGPMEYAGTDVVVACMDGQAGGFVGSTFSDLSAWQGSCTSTSWTSSSGCYAAVNRYCQSLGYLSGYGILNHNGNNAQIGCLRTNVLNH